MAKTVSTAPSGDIFDGAIARALSKSPLAKGAKPAASDAAPPPAAPAKLTARFVTLLRAGDAAKQAATLAAMQAAIDQVNSNTDESETAAPEEVEPVVGQ